MIADNRSTHRTTRHCHREISFQHHNNKHFSTLFIILITTTIANILEIDNSSLEKSVPFRSRNSC